MTGLRAATAKWQEAMVPLLLRQSAGGLTAVTIGFGGHSAFLQTGLAAPQASAPVWTAGNQSMTCS
jgi:hypothetical protein